MSWVPPSSTPLSLYDHHPHFEMKEWKLRAVHHLQRRPVVRKQPIPTHTLNTSVSTMVPFYQPISVLCLGVSSVCSQLFSDSDGRPLRERPGVTGDRDEG